MDVDIIQRLSEDYHGYSKRQKAIAKYIIDNSEAVSFMTANMLARAAQVSDSSVVRFSRQLGFSGYADLRRTLQQLVKDKLETAAEPKQTADAEELTKTVELAQLSLRSVLAPQNIKALELAASLLKSAVKIVVFSGLGMEGLDVYLASGLKRLGLNAGYAAAPGCQDLSELDASTSLVIISGGFNYALIGAARLTRDRGGTVLVLSADGSENLGVFADAVLPGKGMPAVAALIEALLSAIEKDSGRNRLSNLAELEALHREYDTYEPGQN